ncbi:MAG: 16S rRNA (adenine(1518)-N(6)/adenine(1519)-N(6))-dimethyltransferase RsmA [Pseudomonadales bacterium]
MKHFARKRFGQHFLEDEGVLQQIGSAVRPRADDQLLEIGPGHGALTAQLFGSSRRYQAVEIDRDLIAPLLARFHGIELHSADILKVDVDRLLDPPGWRIVGNLPYNITTPLLMKLFESIGAITDMHFMVQRELGARLAAEPGTKAWGRLTVITQYHCEVEALFDVPPEAFVPPPKVHSQVLRLVPRSSPQQVDVHALGQVLRVAFSGRRKRIANALKRFEVDWDRAGVDAGARADQLSVQQYVDITNVVASSPGER